LAESFALHFSGRAASRLHEPPMVSGATRALSQGGKLS